MIKRVFAACAAAALLLGAALAEGGLEADWVDKLQGGGAKFNRDGKYGVVDRDGNVTAEPEWNYMGSFCGQYTVVGLKENEDDIRPDRVGVLNLATGQMTAPVEYDSIKLLPGESGAPMCLVKKDGLWGAMDAEGRMIAEAEYAGAVYSYDDDPNGFWLAEPEGEREGFQTWHYFDAAGHPRFRMEANEVGSFREGMAPVRVDWYWGYADEDGNMVLEPQWDMAYPFMDGRADVYEGGQAGLIDREGSALIEPEWDYVQHIGGDLYAVILGGEDVDGEWWGGEWRVYRLGQGVVSREAWDRIEPDGPMEYNEIGEYEVAECDLLRVEKDGKWGTLTLDMETAIPPEWDYIYGFGGTDMALAIRNGEKYIIDRQGNVLLKSRWDDMSLPSEGRILVSVWEGTLDAASRKYSFVDINGDSVGGQWDNADSFVNGKAMVFAGKTTEDGYPESGRYSLIDAQGQVITDRPWADINWYDYLDECRNWEDHGGLIRARDESGLWGYIRASDGKTAIEPAWDDANAFTEGRAFVKKDGVWRVIDTEGRIVGG